MNQLEYLYSIYKKSREITTDSRSVPEGSVFFALKGENFDGNKYASQALEKGAAIAVVDDELLSDHPRTLLVDDSLKMLQQLAAFHRKQLKAKIIGVTGSNGKTTTKELTQAVLSSKYSCRATIGNLNNHIGVPLTLLSFADSIEFGIVEMGANHVGEIAALCQIADPDYGLITNVGKAHLEGFGGFEGVIRAKTELYKYLEKNNGTVFINSGNDILTKKSEAIKKKVGYGDVNDSISGEIVDQKPFLNLKCLVNSKPVFLETKLVGAYNLENILAAVSIGAFFKVDLPAIQHAIESYQPSNNRSQISKTDYNTLILDAYNANPSSMKAALMNFAAGDYPAKTVILGEMLELGNESSSEHQNLLNLVEKLKFEEVFIVGENFKALESSHIGLFDSTEDLMEYFLKNPIKRRTILIKGSRGNQLEKLVDLL